MNYKKIILFGWISTSLLFAGAQSFAQKKMIQIKGSDTEVNLVQILAEAHMEKHPFPPIAILGGGSGTGIAALINGTCDVAMHSRPLKKKEIEQCQEKGVDIRTFVIAVDGLSVIVNGANPISELSVDQIGAIFRGEIIRWKEVGGPDNAISLYGRQSNSGTYVFFQESVLGNQNYSANMMGMNGNAQIVEGVLQDKYGIGYVGVGYIMDSKTGEARKGLKVLMVSKDSRSQAYSPLDKAVVDSGRYPIVRPLFQSTAGAPEGDVMDFIQFETGSTGQKIIESEGFFTISSKHREENVKNMK